MVQQTVLERGAHGIGVLLSEEAPHGHQALGGAVLPTNLGLGATFDSQGVQEAEAAVAAELAASGIHIALVSGLDIARDRVGAVARNASARTADGLPHVRGHRYRYAG